ncbi:MAG: putative ABC transporter permease [Butyrivibrio sp.]|nr:putative ABC transporter permease [Muribaculum sp.]MCM1552290.1 putative ABC transporter permease [Butyrivibrio sp.]
MLYKWYEFGLMIIFVSFLGFVVENVWLAATKGYMDNRNMNLPFLLGYGLTCIAIYFLMGTPSQMIFFRKISVKASKWCRVLLYFLCAMILVSLGEIALGTITEKLGHIEYWNYTAIPLHITKYTSVPTSIGFSMGITLFMDRYFPALMTAFQQMQGEHIRFVVSAMLVVLTCDYLYCYRKMLKTQDFYTKWRFLMPQRRRQSIPPVNESA